MKKMTVLTAVCAIGVMSGSAFAQTYTVTDLGTPSGWRSAGVAINGAGQVLGNAQTESDEPRALTFRAGVMTDLGNLGEAMTEATAINASGQVTGRSSVTLNAWHAFRFGNGAMTDLGSLGGQSMGLAINDDGQVTGWSYLNDEDFLTAHAFLSSNGVMTDLGTLGGRVSAGTAINASGHVTGYSTTAADKFHAFLFSNGILTDLGTLGGAASSGAAINAAGQVTGYAATAASPYRAFLYSGGVMADLGTLGGTQSNGIAINDAGQVTGVATTVGDAGAHAFLFSDGVMLDLGTLGSAFSVPSAINAAGHVTGWSYVGTSPDQHAFLYSGGTMIDLNSVIPSGSGWTLTRGTAINDRGQITGEGFVNGVPRGFLLTPIATTLAHVQQPIDADGSSVFAAKRGVIPVRFTLTVDGTASCQLPPATIAVTRTSGGTIGAVDESVYAGAADAGSNFRIADCQYVYNLAASSLGPGHYRVDIAIDGVAIGQAEFSLR